MLLLLLFSCSHARDCGLRTPDPGESARCRLPGGRYYDVVLPNNTASTPVIVYFHGGGGSAEGAPGSTAPDGDPDNPAGLSAVATGQGFAVVYAEGTPTKHLRNLHTWNAGGGIGDWQCVSGQACEDGVDDIAYVNAMLDDLESWLDVDTRRVFATGISNGGAMSYRVAHELPQRFAAIAPVAAADQLGVSTDSAASLARPVLHVHGTEDPCWPMAGGPVACLQTDGKDKASVEASLALWTTTNGCADEPVVEALADPVDDGIHNTMSRYNCTGADLWLWTIEGGGHTWPDGDQYLREERVGPVERDINGNELIVSFFADHPRTD